jgi:hypothetical protein
LQNPEEEKNVKEQLFLASTQPVFNREAKRGLARTYAPYSNNILYNMNIVFIAFFQLTEKNGTTLSNCYGSSYKAFPKAMLFIAFTMVTSFFISGT